ncbi:MAG: hypothetical protein LBE89_02095 [Helicobacteraceae bacterium]|nr:hypothetical protein [Helicobacteraceae bacterium]
MNEFRYQPLHDVWTIVAPNRVRKPRPKESLEASMPQNDPFIAGNETKTPNEIYSIREDPSIIASWQTRVFANKFPLLALETPPTRTANGVYASVGGFGAHEMVIDHPKPDKHICSFSIDRCVNLMRTFRDRITSLQQDDRIASVLAFKNEGIRAGNSIAHTNSQILGMPFVAPTLQTQVASSRSYYKEHERCLLCDQIAYEEERALGVLFRNRHFIAFAPFAPRFEFEVWIAPLAHSSSFITLSKDALYDLGETMSWALKRIGVALGMPDLSLILFTQPPIRSHKDAGYFHHLDRFFHWHVEIVPRITSAQGYELSCGAFVCPIAPEEYADYLREINIK